MPHTREYVKFNVTSMDATKEEIIAYLEAAPFDCNDITVETDLVD